MPRPALVPLFVKAMIHLGRFRFQWGAVIWQLTRLWVESFRMAIKSFLLSNTRGTFLTSYVINGLPPKMRTVGVLCSLKKEGRSIFSSMVTMPLQLIKLKDPSQFCCMVDGISISIKFWMHLIIPSSAGLRHVSVVSCTWWAALLDLAVTCWGAAGLGQPPPGQKDPPPPPPRMLA